ncbi:MAG: CinA family protein, partial [Flavobacteriales bacterium]
FNAVDSKLNQAIIEDAINTIEARLPRYLYARNEVSLSEVVGALLLTQEKSLATVESCTGGGIANEITKIAGCSKYFKGSIVSYANEVKISNVNVSEVALEKYGAVSREVVEQMAINGKARLNVDYCISTSGVAGPDGGSSEKPVGFVWIAIATPEGVFSLNKTFGNSRERIIKSAVLTSLNLLRCELMNIL